MTHTYNGNTMLDTTSMPKKLEKIEQESSSYTHMGQSSKQINKCKQYVTIYFKGEGTEYIYIYIHCPEMYKISLEG